MDPIPLILDAECLPSEVYVRQTGDLEKVLHESELDGRTHQHLQDQEKVQKLDDSKKDQELDDLKKNQKLNDLLENQESDMQRKLMDKGFSSVARMKLRKSLTIAPW